MNKEKVYALLHDHVKKNDATDIRQFAEVLTPLSLVEDMLGLLPEWVWRDPTLKWFEPSVGVGHFMVSVYFRLMGSLDMDLSKRSKHIIKNMLYMSEINPKNAKICRRIFGNAANIHVGDTLKLDIMERWGINRFDVILGNPPYNDTFFKKGCVRPIYNIFVDRLIDKCRLMLFIIPSRWFCGGKGLGVFRRNMLARKDLKLINYYEKSNVLFPRHACIMGGVCVFLKDDNHNGYCQFNNYICDINKYDILVEPKYQTIVDKVLIQIETSLSDICVGQTYSGVNSNDSRLRDTPSPDHCLCHVSENNGSFKYIDKSMLQDRDYSKWKVFTVEANGYWKRFGRTIIGCPGDTCNQSYVVFVVDSLRQAVSLYSYLNTKLVNFMLGVRKMSQHISPDTCKWIPLLPLDRIYTDDYVNNYFNLDMCEVGLVNDAQNDIPKKVIKDIDALGEYLSAVISS
jgi:site-specific DNA-methyltransferase (adenine-specific)